MTIGAERPTVQSPLVRYATQAGWTYLPPQEALRLRRGEGGLVLHEVLARQIQRLNPGVVDAQKAKETIRRLLLVQPAIEGDLGNFLMGALPNATYISFTGMPIDKAAYGKGTFKVFGTDDPKGYLDKYSIREYIQDGTTVPLQSFPRNCLVDTIDGGTREIFTPRVSFGSGRAWSGKRR